MLSWVLENPVTYITDIILRGTFRVLHTYHMYIASYRIAGLYGSYCIFKGFYFQKFKKMATDFQKYFFEIFIATQLLSYIGE